MARTPTATRHKTRLRVHKEVWIFDVQSKNDDYVQRATKAKKDGYLHIVLD